MGGGHILQDISDIASKIYVYYDNPKPLPKKKSGQTWVALLIDGDGLCVWLDKALPAAEALGEVVVKRIYGNYHIDSKYTQWAGIYRKYHFDRRVMLGVHKNIADMSIVAEAVELALTVPEIDVFIIMTHDGGFFPLMHKLVALGKKVYWIGGEKPYRKAELLRADVEQRLEAWKNKK